jgi:hypothetical protein
VVEPWLQRAAWHTVTAPATCGTLERSPAFLDRCISQFDVENAERYRANAKQTWCNIFASDVTKALGCEIPHVILKGASWAEQSANDMFDWMFSTGILFHGWRESGPREAQAFADAGKVGVALYKNNGRGIMGIGPRLPGHIAVLTPSHGQDGVWIAQAGRANFRRAPLAMGFGTLPVLFFVHD